MNINRQTSYKEWLDELKTTPSEVFFSTFRQILNFLIKENPAKMGTLQEQEEKERNKIIYFERKAIEELEELLKKVECEAKRKKIQTLPEIDKYQQAKQSDLPTREKLPDILYSAIRLTVEKHWGKGEFKKLDNLMSENKSSWYFDYDKVCKDYPSYRQFKEAEDMYNREYKEEPWGAYKYLKFATTFFKGVTPEQAGIFVKSDIINNLRRLVLYLSTHEADKDRKRPTKFIGITHLFFLSKDPFEIYYEGSIKNKREWVPVKGKTQPFAILQLVAEKYKRKSVKDNSDSSVRLGEIEIKGCLSDPKICDRSPNWKATIPPKRRLNLLAKNIRNVVPFTKDELGVEEHNQTPYLIFRPNKRT